ncbi:MAG: dihydrofolate reductase [Bacillota bacterium]|nr:dihydrofolate reductase [Bacillota bacterium]
MDAIVAVFSDWGIGADGTQQVVLKADRANFVERTRGKTVIVGRRTLADFPGGRPLKNRRNIVITRQNIEIEGAELAHTVEEAVALAGEEPCMILGGASVFRDFYPYMDRVYVTKIDVCPESDSFFPNLDESPEWSITEDSGELWEEGLRYRFLCYERSSAE